MSNTNDMSIDELHMTNSTRNLLKRNGIHTRESLSNMTIEKLAEMPSVAQKRCYEIVQAIRESKSTVM